MTIDLMSKIVLNFLSTKFDKNKVNLKIILADTEPKEVAWEYFRDIVNYTNFVNRVIYRITENYSQMNYSNIFVTIERRSDLISTKYINPKFIRFKEDLFMNFFESNDSIILQRIDSRVRRFINLRIPPQVAKELAIKEIYIMDLLYAMEGIWINYQSEKKRIDGLFIIDPYSKQQIARTFAFSPAKLCIVDFENNDDINPIYIINKCILQQNGTLYPVWNIDDSWIEKINSKINNFIINNQKFLLIYVDQFIAYVYLTKFDNIELNYFLQKLEIFLSRKVYLESTLIDKYFKNDELTNILCSIPTHEAVLTETMNRKFMYNIEKIILDNDTIYSISKRAIVFKKLELILLKKLGILC